MISKHILKGCPRGVMVKACYYVHFRANTLGKGMNPLILPSMLKSTVLLGEWLWH